MKRITIWAVLLLFGISIITVAQGKKAKEKSGGGSSNVEQTIKKLENESREAALKGDSSFAEKYQADIYVRVYADGTVGDRQTTINSFKNGTVKYTSIEPSEQQVKVAGDVAVVIFKTSVKGTFEGRSIDGDFRGLRTWAKQGGQWKVVSFSTTRIGAPAQ